MASDEPPSPMTPRLSGEGGSAAAGIAGGVAVGRTRAQCAHGDLVRSVAMGKEFVVTGSYDLGVKVWERKGGRLVADLKGTSPGGGVGGVGGAGGVGVNGTGGAGGGHSGRIFCVGFDCTKVVSCGEDQVRRPLTFLFYCVVDGVLTLLFLLFDLLL